MRLYRVIMLSWGLLCLTSQAWGQGAGADQISKAYVKELSFLKAQKKALKQRAESYQARSAERIRQANADLKRLELGSIVQPLIILGLHSMLGLQEHLVSASPHVCWHQRYEADLKHIVLVSGEGELASLLNCLSVH